MSFEVMSRQCDQCLFSKQRIVSASRAAQIIRDCRRKDASFECHKGSIAGRSIVCRAHFETGIGQMARIAGRLGAIVEIDPDTLRTPALTAPPSAGDPAPLPQPHAEAGLGGGNSSLNGVR